MASHIADTGRLTFRCLALPNLLQFDQNKQYKQCSSAEINHPGLSYWSDLVVTMMI